MPILVRDPWRVQYFDAVPCPAEVSIPVDDPDAWLLYPRHRWVYDKLRVAETQGIAAGPHGVSPAAFPVFSKPLINLNGMGVGSAPARDAAELQRLYQPGHMWMTLLEGDHVSTDCAVVDGRICWLRHAHGLAGPGGTFQHWVIEAAARPGLEAYLEGWVARHMDGYTGMMNFETIGGRIIEAHLRFADQWCDLYGPGWVEALVGLYEKGQWRFAEGSRREAYSIPLFAAHGQRFRHPPPERQAAIRAMPGVNSLQITFHDSERQAAQAMPPGGFRLGIINATALPEGLAAREALAQAFPAAAF